MSGAENGLKTWIAKFKAIMAIGGTRQSLRALDAVNLFVGDIQGSLAPFVGVYLLTVRQWDVAQAGFALAAMGLATVLAQLPAGAAIDRFDCKRLLLGAAVLLVGAGNVLATRLTDFAELVACLAVAGAASALVAPALAAMSLGVVGYRRFPLRLGRNEWFKHLGAVAGAVAAGAAGYLWGYARVFELSAAGAAAAAVCVALVRSREIDHGLARGAGAANLPPLPPGTLLADSRIGLLVAAMALFHLSNAAMLPLAGQWLAAGRGVGEAPFFIAACIAIAQLVMMSAATAGSRAAKRWGRKPVFLIGFAVLPVRGVLFALSGDPFFALPIQILDGIGAGIFGVVSTLMIADLTRGSGRFNFVQGLAATLQGIGAALSNGLGGYLAHAAGYRAAFLALAAIAVLALSVFAFGVGETLPAAAAGREPVWRRQPPE